MRRDQRKERPKRSVSFNWGTKTTMVASPNQPRQMRRPTTQPDLFSWRTSTTPGDASSLDKEERVPSKLLVNVTVDRSSGPVQLMASALWTVNDLIAATLDLYVKEVRRPLLPTTLLSNFTLHYSQFSLQGLDPKEKLMELGSRNFFLHINSAADASSCSDQVHKSSEIDQPWFNFAGLLL